MNPYLFPALEYGPAIFDRLISHLDQSKFDEPTSPGRFSPREVVAHLADWEPILLARLHQTLSQPGSTQAVFNEGEMAIAHNYKASDIREQLQLFADRRKTTLTLLKSLAEEDWEKSALHPERGVLTIREQAFTLVGHDVYHIDQITAVL
jgi:uncharacterized damage-inducible protein DinB